MPLRLRYRIRAWFVTGIQALDPSEVEGDDLCLGLTLVVYRMADMRTLQQ